jgi:hypothetical protein
VSDEPEDWRWANAEGVINAINELELLASLSRGRIEPSSLVWRKGWAEWMPAAQVRELVSAVPQADRASVISPRRDPQRLYPPPLPAGLVRPAPVGNVSRPPPKPPKLPHRKHTPVPVTRPSRPPGAPQALVTPIPPPRVSTLPGPDFRPPSRPPDARAPIPTLVDMPDATATGTLRPPGAVPPPPRAVPPTPRNFEVLDELPELTPTGPITPIGGMPTPRRFSSPPVPSTDIATQPSASETPLPETPDPITERDAMRAFRNRPTEPPTRRRSAPAPGAQGTAPPTELASTQTRELPRRYAVALFALSILAGLLAVTVIYLLVGSSSGSEPTSIAAAQSAAVASAPEPEKSGPPCELVSAAERLSTSVVGSIPPFLAVAPSTPHVAVGFAESPTTASGLVFELPGLQTQRMFTQTVKDKLLGVVPVFSKNEFGFAVDVEKPALRSQRTIDGPAPFAIGLDASGIVRQSGDSAPEVIWPDAIQDRITEMRVASVAKDAHAVTFRRGGQSGSVLFGWLNAEGRKQSELLPVATDGGLSGTPTVAQNGKAVLLSYAWRPNTDVYWSVRLATATVGALPDKPAPFHIPPGGPGAEAISPAATGLPDGRWLLQWTEGSSGARQVRAQVLNADLSPQSKAFTLSRPDQNAGQGALASRGPQALALYLVAKGGGHELWGASLKCP